MLAAVENQGFLDRGVREEWSVGGKNLLLRGLERL